MYISLSSPGAEIFGVDKTVSSSSVSACSLFARYIECSLSGCCFSRADLTSLGLLSWSGVFEPHVVVLALRSPIIK